jgi:hypothetical protein
MTLPPRARARAMATARAGQHSGGQHALAVPLALRLAARIQERPLDSYFTDPTQLANGLRDFLQAVAPDGLVVTDPDALAADVTAADPDALASAPRVSAALEAARRLRGTVGDGAVLVACLPGPAAVAGLRAGRSDAAEVVHSLAKEFLGAGADVILLAEKDGAAADEATLRTIANMARFHRALAYLSGTTAACMAAPAVMPLDRPAPAAGLVVTDRDLPPDTSLTAVQAWTTAVRRGDG